MKRDTNRNERGNIHGILIFLFAFFLTVYNRQAFLSIERDYLTKATRTISKPHLSVETKTKLLPPKQDPSQTACFILSKSTLYAPHCPPTPAATEHPIKVLPLLVTGTGRSGTLFVSDFLSSLGWNISHDNLGPGEHGAVSWPQTFNRNHCRRPPWNWHVNLEGKRTGFDYRFRAVFQLIRSPLKVILSRANGGEFWNSVNLRNIRCNTRLMAGLILRSEMKQIRKEDSEEGFTDMDYSLILSLRHWVLWNTFLDRVAIGRFRIEDLGDLNSAKQIVEEMEAKTGLRETLGKLDDERIERAWNKISKKSDENSKHTFKPGDFQLSWKYLFKLDPEFALMGQSLSVNYGYELSQDDILEGLDEVEMNCKVFKTEKWGCILKKHIEE
eukprot:augustus_masked-scaffold_35-processed-gene-2.62-mRNA-1 protein AED:1.00 eAED:1.00 QI:0/-1/0/0/-1/1/1/0/384